MEWLEEAEATAEAVEKTAEEEEAKEPRPEPSKEDGEIRIKKETVEDSKAILETLKGAQNAEDIAVRLASLISKKLEKQEEMLKQKMDELYYESPEGREVKKVLEKYGKFGMTKEAAQELVRDGRKFAQTEMRTRDMDSGTGIFLNDSDRRVLAAFGVKPEEYYKAIQEIQQGIGATSTVDGGIEVMIPVIPEEGSKKNG